MLAHSELKGANEKCQTYWPWCMQRERGDGEEKNADAINLRDKTDPLTRRAQLSFEMTASISLPSIVCPLKKRQRTNLWDVTLLSSQNASSLHRVQFKDRCLVFTCMSGDIITVMPHVLQSHSLISGELASHLV